MRFLFMLKVKGGAKQSAADLLIETVGFQALEDHRVQDGVRTVRRPFPGNDARRAQTREQVIHQAENLTWWTHRGRGGGGVSCFICCFSCVANQRHVLSLPDSVNTVRTKRI